MSRQDFVQAFARGLAVIECFDEENSKMKLSEVARRVGLTRPSARRALLTLQSLGYVALEGDRFLLTARVLRLGYAYLASEPLWALARHCLDQLRLEIGQNCTIGVWDGNEVVVVARSVTKRIINDEFGIGFRWPAYASALGRVLLSQLDDATLDGYFARIELKRFTPLTEIRIEKLRHIIKETRKRRWASSDQQLDGEMRSISVPIIDKYGTIIAALNTSGRAHLIETEGMVREYLPSLKRAAEEISRIAISRSHVGQQSLEFDT